MNTGLLCKGGKKIVQLHKNEKGILILSKFRAIIINDFRDNVVKYSIVPIFIWILQRGCAAPQPLFALKRKTDIRQEKAGR